MGIALILTAAAPSGIASAALSSPASLGTSADGTSLGAALIYGDCDNDGDVDSSDFAWFKQYLLTPGYTYISSLDLNIDNSVNSIDFAIMKQYLLGIIDTLPYGNSGDTEAPTAPTALECTSKTVNSVALKWSASSDNLGVTGYEIYKDGVPAGTSYTTSYTVTGLNAGTLYSFTVIARDAAGNLSPASSALQVTTQFNSNAKLIALTFDDGPSPVTSLILDKLEQYNITASFFVIGQNINDETKSILQRQLSLGCEINNHSWTHSYMSGMTAAQITDEINKTSNAIYHAVGVWPKFFRPPYMSISNTMYETIELPFICGISCNDWEPSVSAEARAAAILNSVREGDIILLHDFYGNTQTVDALDAIIQGLLDKGFSFVTVSEMFEQKGVNPNVKYRLWTNVAK
ncbi:peptidoglycan/xylan/chitin deacetylase (PgdA/CDA1 family) [Anaerobacterium chartisolvens]|uniref:Peptidoglycan/xylan/chitin deacetylase (PgdA/CDA1 family) n=1 Tax=Anaerobacterium chartisolvens TaxID=1297424 RepID=A0A369B6P7_9FIRM|nr:polysaccharide deacetylase family protein [Anaerobacterium chartisolvens]RCX17111.1 peptidoglycan/xylan/chitin deacetylase (PgdA/CDA1 family) [Anaerobacterium chartisolvens]